MGITKKHLARITAVFLLVLIVLFQLKKRSSQLELVEKQKQSIKNAKSEYAKLISQRSVYSDSIYKIYVANIKGNKELVFLRKGALTDMQKESNFFVHVYPKNPQKLIGKANHNPINFENNFTSFLYNGKEFHIAHTILPNYKVEKLNLGQYAFRGDNSINYKIEHLIESKHIAKILKENKEDMAVFDYVEEIF